MTPAASPSRHVVVLLDADGVWSREATLLERFRVCVHAAALDERLAAGEPPESDVLLALRAERLARIDCRRMLARSLRRLLAECEPRRTRLPFERRPQPLAVVPRIAAAHDDLEQLVDGLLAPVPVSARGVAAASCLLRDGSGPLYRYECTADLRVLVRRTIDALDPAVDWPTTP